MQRYQNSVLLGGPGCVTPAPYAEITVYLAGTLTLAELFETNDHAPLVNPFQSDDQGNFFFYAEDGRYDIHVVVPGRPEQWLRDTLLEDINEEGLVHLRDIEVKDGLIDPAASWPDVPSVGQPNGVGSLNVQAQALAARTKQNRDRIDALNGIPGRVTVLEQDTTALQGEVDDLQERALNGDFFSYETDADMQADLVNRAEGDSLRVTNDPDPEKNGYYTVYEGVAVYSGLQPVSRAELYSVVTEVDAAVDGLSLVWKKSTGNFLFSPYVSFDDAIDFDVVDFNGIQINSETLLDVIRNVGRYSNSPYLSFDDAEVYLVVDKYGRPLLGQGEQPTPGIASSAGRIFVEYLHSSQSLYVTWQHDDSTMLRTLWKPNGANGLFNFRAIWSAPGVSPAGAVWTLIQEVNTDYIPPITHEATTGDVTPNVLTTGGNHLGAEGQLTAAMQSCEFFLEDTRKLTADYEGWASSVTVRWRNLIMAGNTVIEERYTTQQDVRARFTERNVEVLSKVTALEPIKIWREGGTQLVGTGWQDRYHFWGGIQEGSVAGDSGILNGGTKAQAPTLWACVCKSDTLGYVAAYIDRSFGAGMDLVQPDDLPAQKNVSSYKFYNFTVKDEANQYHMDTGDSYTWRGGYSYAPLGIVDDLDGAFLFNQAGRRRLAIANTAETLGGTVRLPLGLMTTDFETVGGVDDLGTAVSFGTYTARAYKELQ